jgi:hypothetical protein
LSAQLVDNKIVSKGCLSLTHTIEIFLQRYEFAGTKYGRVCKFFYTLLVYAASGENFLDKKMLSQPAFVFDRPITLNAPDDMFCPDPERRNHPVALFLFRS